VLVIANLSSGEKKIEHKIERLYPSDDPQFLRAIGLPLGSPVVGGNRFDLLMNGEQILPSMLEGIRCASYHQFQKLIYRHRRNWRRDSECAAGQGAKENSRACTV